MVVLNVAQSSVKIIIFDFDGTIANSFDAVLQIMNRLAKEFGYAPASPEEIKHYQNLSSKEILKQSQIPLYKLPFLLRRLKQEMSRDIESLEPIPGIQATLLALKAQGYSLGIVTSNTRKNVSTFLKRHQIENVFDFLHSGVALFGKAKSIQQILKQNGFDPASVVYVGDETRDIEAVHKINIKVIAVGWGFNSVQALQEEKPSRLVRSPKELIEAIQSL